VFATEWLVKDKGLALGELRGAFLGLEFWEVRGLVVRELGITQSGEKIDFWKFCWILSWLLFGVCGDTEGLGGINVWHFTRSIGTDGLTNLWCWVKMSRCTLAAVLDWDCLG
uniref:Uncharacterized protein n=1 Tax=Ciona intestinalis TaxID=7719 RepID=H2XVC7_CIOIN